MTIQSLGSMSIGTLCPSSLAASLALLPGLQANLQGMTKVFAALTIKPPALAANIDAVMKVAAHLTASVEGPTVTLQISALAGLIAQLNVQIAAALAFQATLGTAGVQVFAYDGTAASMGSEVTSATGAGLAGGAPGDHVNALILATSLPATWAAMQAFFTTV